MGNETKERLDFKQAALDYMDDNAGAFTERTGDARPQGFIHFQGQTLIYDGRKYGAVSETELKHDVRRFLMRRGSPHDTHKVGNVVADIQAIAGDGLRDFDGLPFHLGSGVKAGNIIAYRNGLLDVEQYVNGGRELMPHSHEWVSTACLPFDFDPSADCPQYDAFLDWAMDREYQTLWHEWGGYCLTPNISFQKFLLKFGPAGSGKGTTDRILQAVMGAGNWTGFNLASIANNPRFACNSLVGKLAAFIGETELPKHDKQIIVERLKSITGGDAQEIEYKQLNDKPSVVLTARLNISCNSMPKFIDTTAALRRRMLLIRFTRSVPSDRQDGELFSRFEAELSGINNRFLDGLARLRRQGRFTEPTDMQERLADVFRGASPELAFLQDCCVVERRFDTGILQEVPLSDEPLASTSKLLEPAWNGWRDGITDEPFQWFIKNLRDLIPDLKAKRRRDKDGGWTTEYRGIALRPVTY
jgi:putative DNA primase/helicase